MFLALLFLTHQIGICIYRVVATASRQIVVANAAGMLLLLCVFLMNGFVIRRQYIHPGSSGAPSALVISSSHLVKPSRIY